MNPIFKPQKFIEPWNLQPKQ